MGKDKKTKKGKHSEDFGEEEVEKPEIVGEENKSGKRGKKGRAKEQDDGDEDFVSNKKESAKSKSKVSLDEENDEAAVPAKTSEKNEKRNKKSGKGGNNKKFDNSDNENEEDEKEEKEMAAKPAPSSNKGKAEKIKKEKVKNRKRDSSEDEDEERELQNDAKNVRSGATVTKSAFQLLEVEDNDMMDVDDDVDSDAQEETPSVVAVKDDKKAGKKSKKKDRKKKDNDEDDLEKMLEELALEIEGKKPSSATKDAPSTGPSALGAGGGVNKDDAQPDAFVGAGKKKKNKKLEKMESLESTEVENAETVAPAALAAPVVKDAAVDDAGGDGDDGDGEGGTVKSAAQKRKEKKERERLKKVAQNTTEKLKKEKEKEKQKETTPEMETVAVVTPVPPTPSLAAPAAPSVVLDDKEMGEDEDGDDDDKSAKNKKKKKGAKVVEDEKDKKRPGKKAIAAMQEALKKMKDEEDRLRLEEEAKELAAEKAEEERLEKIRLEQERKEKKKLKEKEKKERLKAEGKLLTKAQKQARARMEATLTAFRQQGIEVPQIGEKKERVPRLGDRKKPIKKKDVVVGGAGAAEDQNSIPGSTASSATATVGSNDPNNTTKVPQIELKIVDDNNVIAGSKESSPDSESVKESWEEEEEIEVKDTWDESSGDEKELLAKKNAALSSNSPAKTKIISPLATTTGSSSSANASAAAKSGGAPSAGKGPQSQTKNNASNKNANSQSKKKAEESEDDDDDDEDEDDSSEDDSSSDDDSDSDESDNENYKKMKQQEKIREKVMLRIQRRKEDAEKNRSVTKLRSPVVCVLGHVDTGKTKILDKIRNTHVQDGEAGGITQQIGATMVPLDALKEQCKMVKNFMNLEVKLPGLLIIDTPGHESFSNLRSRGSSLCDIAILVVDIMHGLEPQTIESLNMLKQRKTPFIVALNKIDRLYEWKSNKNKDIQDVIRSQQRNTKLEFEERTKEVVLQIAEQGLNAALCYENTDQRSYVSLVPTSAFSGDGMGNLLGLVVELSQTLLAKRLAFSDELQATVLEVKAIPGLGTTIDVILVNGTLKEGDTAVLAGHEGPVVTQIRSLLMPQPLKELRVKNPYSEFKQVEAAQGIKIAGKDLDKAIAGLQLLVAHSPDEIDFLKEEVANTLKDAMNAIKLTDRGVYVQASTLGSLEALLEFLKTSKIPYSGIRIGPVVKKDVMKASIMLEHDNQFAAILAFDVKVERDAQDLADSLGVRIFQANIIYHLFDSFMAYRDELQQKRRNEFKHVAVFPCKIRILPQFIFNSRDPIVVGVSIEAGVVKEGTPLCVPSRENLEIGTVTTIEINHKTVESARKGQEVCLKIESMGGEAPKMFGRHFDETDILVSKISRQSIDACKEYFRDDLQKTDWQLMVELKKMFQIL